jgi:hypothetical protein
MIGIRADRPTDEQLTAAYRELGSVWKVGERFQMPGQSAHRRLRRIGVDTTDNRFTPTERARIKEYYETTPPAVFDLSVLASELNRTRATVCREAGRSGLTAQGRPMSAKKLAAMKASKVGVWSRIPHPRGMAGKKHTAETLAIVSESSKRYWATCKTFGVGLMSEEQKERRSTQASERMRRRPPDKIYTRARGGRRTDLGDTWFRSSWEANYARYLNLLKRLGVVEHWDFEKECFWFEGIRRGVTSYRPDFRIKYKGDDQLEYVEIKGWVQPKDRTKWARMKRYHPHIKLVVVGNKEYQALKSKWASSIPTWEGVHGGGRKTGPRKRAA